MIKLTFCLTRLPNLTLAEFQDYWWNKHAPLVKSHREAHASNADVRMRAWRPLSEGIRGRCASGGGSTRRRRSMTA